MKIITSKCSMGFGYYYAVELPGGYILQMSESQYSELMRQLGITAVEGDWDEEDPRILLWFRQNVLGMCSSCAQKLIPEQLDYARCPCCGTT